MLQTPEMPAAAETLKEPEILKMPETRETMAAPETAGMQEIPALHKMRKTGAGAPRTLPAKARQTP